MLENAGALSNAESKWLEALEEWDKGACDTLRSLLIVPKFWRPGQRGVWKREDRNRVRMQTLKAAVAEGLKASRKEGKYFDRRSLHKVLEKATNVRNALTRKIPRQSQRLYEVVNTETLRNPQRLYKLHNFHEIKRRLWASLQRPRKIHADIKDGKGVAKAAQALLDNDLLDTEAARTLLERLRNGPEDINALMALDRQNLPSGTDLPSAKDRLRLRSVVLMKMVYSPRTVEALLYKNSMFENVWVLDPITYSPTGEMRPRYKTIPEVPPAGKTSPEKRGRLLSFMELKERREFPEVVSVERPPSLNNVANKPLGDYETYINDETKTDLGSIDEDDFKGDEDENTVEDSVSRPSNDGEYLSDGGYLSDNESKTDA